jgi:peptidyl-prolyl cis-trans isomerase D
MMPDAPLDPALLDSPELRFAALEGLVRERLLVSHAVRSGITVTDQQLREFITSQQIFQAGGQFSHDLFESYLRSQNLSQVGFEARVRRDLLQQPLMNAFGETGFVPQTLVDRVVRLSEQAREVTLAEVSPSTFLPQVKVDDAAVQSYYEGHKAEFQVPEQVRVEYVVLSLDNLAAQIDVAEQEVRQAYEQNRARYTTSEERRARHILIPVAASANAEVKAEAKAKIEELLKQAQAKPEAFAELARTHSQDPGSAPAGGDLGFLERGATKKPFDDALFAMKEGAIVGPVETEFGYHLIKLEEVRGGAVKAFEAVRAAIESDLKRVRAQRLYAEAAEKLNNMAYEQSESLKPAAEQLKLPVQQSPWISRQPQPGSPLGGERFLKAVFSEDVLKNQRNSEVVEVAPGTLI